MSLGKKLIIFSDRMVCSTEMYISVIIKLIIKVIINVIINVNKYLVARNSDDKPLTQN